MTHGERFALAGAVGLLLLQALANFSAPVGAALEYQRAALAAQPWRLVTAHFVHINAVHVVINAAAWVVVAWLYAKELSARRQAIAVAVASVAITGGLAAFYPAVAWYRGFSGVLHALFFAGAAAWLGAVLGDRAHRSLARLALPAALFAGGWVKVIGEQSFDGATPYAAWLGAATVPQAHLIGALCGALLGVAFAARPVPRSNAAPAREEAEQAEQ